MQQTAQHNIICLNIILRYSHKSLLRYKYCKHTNCSDGCDTVSMSARVWITTDTWFRIATCEHLKDKTYNIVRLSKKKNVYKGQNGFNSSCTGRISERRRWSLNRIDLKNCSSARFQLAFETATSDNTHNRPHPHPLYNTSFYDSICRLRSCVRAAKVRKGYKIYYL